LAIARLGTVLAMDKAMACNMCLQTDRDQTALVRHQASAI